MWNWSKTLSWYLPKACSVCLADLVREDITKMVSDKFLGKGE